MCADGFADGVVGEVELTVEHEGRMIHLPEVVVFKNLVEPFLLGMEWIDAAHVAVMANDHAGVVVYRGTTEKQVLMESGDSSSLTDMEVPIVAGKTQESPGPTVIHADQETSFSELPATKEEKEPTVPSANLIVVSGHEQAFLEPGGSSKPSVKEIPVKAGKTQESPDRTEFPRQKRVSFAILPSAETSSERQDTDKDLIPETVPQVDVLKKGDSRTVQGSLSFDEWRKKRLKLFDTGHEPGGYGNFDEVARDMRQIGAISAETRESRPRAPPREKLHPLKGQRLPGWSRGFITCKTPGRRNGSWMIFPASGIAGGRGWATPACLVTATDGLVEIPVSNAYHRGCRWRDVRGWIEATSFDEEREVVRETNIIAVIGKVEHEWLNCPIESFDHLLDDALTEEQADAIKTILERHVGLFSKKKGLTHLILRRLPRH
jgi:hypothetical protein